MPSEPLFTQINRHHLADSILQTYQEEFEGSALSAIQIDQFLSPEVADAVALFLEEGASFGPTYGLFRSEGHTVDEAHWSAAEEHERFFHYEMMDGPKAGWELSPLMLKYIQLRKALCGADFRDFASRICSKELKGATEPRIHRMAEEHYLKPHDDRSRGRTIAYILYLSRDWEEAFGGQLSISAGEAECRFAPLFNSLVLFDVTAHDTHYVQPISALAKGRARYSIGGWLKTSSDEPGEPGSIR